MRTTKYGPYNSGNSSPSHTAHDCMRIRDEPRRNPRYLAHSSTLHRKTEEAVTLNSSTIGNTRTQTRNQPLILDQWALIIFHIWPSVIDPHQFGISEGFLCLSCGIYTWPWLLFDRGSFWACDYQTKPVSMHMERERLHTPHWTNISITWRPCHIQQPIYIIESETDIRRRQTWTQQAHMLQIYTKPEKRNETIGTNPNGLWVFRQNKTRNAILLPRSLLDSIYTFYEGVPPTPILHCCGPIWPSAFPTADDIYTTDYLVNQADSHPDLSFLNLHLQGPFDLDDSKDVFKLGRISLILML